MDHYLVNMKNIRLMKYINDIVNKYNDIKVILFIIKMIVYLTTCDKTSHILPATIYLYKKFFVENTRIEY